MSSSSIRGSQIMAFALKSSDSTRLDDYDLPTQPNQPIRLYRQVLYGSMVYTAVGLAA